MLLYVLAIFAAATVAPVLVRAVPMAAAWILAALPAGLFAVFATAIPDIATGGLVLEHAAWLPALDVNLNFRLDGLSLLFALLITGIGTLVTIYAGAYLKHDPGLDRFFLSLFLFMGAMLGLVLADGLILFFVFWELTSIASFLLIGTNHKDPSARRSALQALLVTGSGGLALLAGLILIGLAANAWSFTEILALDADALTSHALALPITLLILAGAFTKSAQVPFHFWLPNAMDAPTPVSAYLHSATMVKAGVYLLARLNPALGGTELWMGCLVGFGAATALIGGLLAVRQTDLKRILAYTTVTVLGQLVMLIGVGTSYGYQAFAIYLLAHSLYKGALFMGAGTVDHATGTRDVTRLGGLWKLMPVTGAAIALAALSNAGIPPALGFIAKEFKYVGILDLGTIGWLVTGTMVITNGLLLAAAGLVFLKPFLGARPPDLHPHQVGVGLLLGPVVLASLGFLFGLFNGWPETWLINAAVQAVAPEPVKVDLYLWGGLSTALVLSVVTLSVGAFMYRHWPAKKAALDRAAVFIRYDSDRWYDFKMDLFLKGAEAMSRAMQHGNLRFYLMVVMAAAALTVGSLYLTKADVWPLLRVPDAPVAAWVICALIAVAALASVITNSRLSALLCLGMVGLLAALIYLLYGAPDVAITQFMIETLIVIFIVLLLARLPRYAGRDRQNSLARGRDALVAAAVGAMTTMVLLGVTAIPIPLAISEYFGANAFLEAFGRNVVNVILVDFRALDTLGEVLVVVVAAAGSVALLRSGRRTSDPHREGPKQETSP